MQQASRDYQFISDPQHKENLSGRVTAACLQCRRKKIKCSGQVNCRQCLEKGTVCEGPPSRKRPKRDYQASNNDDSVTETSSQSGDVNSERHTTATLDPHTSLLHHEDSGYASIEQQSRSSKTPSVSRSPTSSAKATADEVATSNTSKKSRRIVTTFPKSDRRTSANVDTAQRPSRFAFDASNSNRRASNVSPTATSSREQSFKQRPLPIDTGGPQPAMLSRQLDPSQAYQSPASAASRSSTVPQSVGRRDSGSQWSAGRSGRQSPTTLLQAAEALEERAQSLRHLAFNHQADDFATQQMEPQASYEHQGMAFDTATFGVGSLNGSPYRGLQPYESYSGPGTAFFRPDMSIRAGLTPGTGDVASWWDASHPHFTPQQPSFIGSLPSDGSDTDYGQARLQRAFHHQLARPTDTDDVEEHDKPHQHRRPR